MREKVQGELQDLMSHSKNAVGFLKFIAENYMSYQMKKVEFSERSLKMDKLKKTITKACVYYHPDKQNTVPGAFDAKQIYLRTQICKILTKFLNTMKLPEERKDANADDSTDDEKDTPKPEEDKKAEPEAADPQGSTQETQTASECSKCKHKETSAEAKFCSNCGQKYEKNEDMKQE